MSELFYAIFLAYAIGYETEFASKKGFRRKMLTMRCTRQLTNRSLKVTRPTRSSKTIRTFLNHQLSIAMALSVGIRRCVLKYILMVFLRTCIPWCSPTAKVFNFDTKPKTIIKEN